LGGKLSREHRSEWDLSAPHEVGWSASREIHRSELGLETLKVKAILRETYLEAGRERDIA